MAVVVGFKVEWQTTDHSLDASWVSFGLELSNYYINLLIFRIFCIYYLSITRLHGRIVAPD